MARLVGGRDRGHLSPGILTLASVAPLVTHVASGPRSGGSRNHDDVTLLWSEPLQSHTVVVGRRPGRFRLRRGDARAAQWTRSSHALRRCPRQPCTGRVGVSSWPDLRQGRIIVDRCTPDEGKGSPMGGASGNRQRQLPAHTRVIIRPRSRTMTADAGAVRGDSSPVPPAAWADAQGGNGPSRPCPM